MASSNLNKAKFEKFDEFYTRFEDIEREVEAYIDYNPNVFQGKTVLLPCDDPEWSNFTRYFAQNFQRLGLRKLVSTSYALESKKFKEGYPLTLFESDAPQFDESKSKTHGKIFVLTKDIDGDGRIDLDDLEWQYLEGDGDFRSPELRQLRDEADIIVTNPPFSLSREFFSWVMEKNKKFLLIVNVLFLTNKDIFPLIKNNKVWRGYGFQNGNSFFRTPTARDYANGVYDESTGYVKFRNCCWITNMEHGRRHKPLVLMTMADNIKYSKHASIKGIGYSYYDNYNAIEVPYIDSIPADFEGIMGVPATFLDKYCPEQFEIVGNEIDLKIPKGRGYVNGKRKTSRIFIRKIKGNENS